MADTPKIPKGWRRVTRGKVRRGDRLLAMDALTVPPNWVYVVAEKLGEVGSPVVEFSSVIRKERAR